MRRRAFVLYYAHSSLFICQIQCADGFAWATKLSQLAGQSGHNNAGIEARNGIFQRPDAGSEDTETMTCSSTSDGKDMARCHHFYEAIRDIDD
jgi:hypothetical protein